MGSDESVPSQQPAAADGGESVPDPDGAVPTVPGMTHAVLVSLLRGRIRFGPDVVAQALIELERAGRLSVEPYAGPGGRAVRLADSALEDPGAPPWERLITRRLGSRALPGTPTPLSLLTTVDGGDYWEWRHRFEQDLLERARQTRLIERRLAPRRAVALVCLVTLLLAAAVGCVVAVFFRPSPGFGAALATALFGFILFSTAFGRLSAWRLTEAGRRTADSAGAAAGSADPETREHEDAIRTAVLPLSKNHVWSSHGGSWRVVGLGSRFGDAKRLPRQVREALPDRRVLACQVVKRWIVPGGRERSPAYCCAFDDGASSFTWSFNVPEKTWATLAVGSTALVDFSPRRHRLYRVEPVDGADL